MSRHAQPGRMNPAHHHTHEQRVSAATYKGVGGRRDEMSVWGLEGRIHTECAHFKDISGSPIGLMDFTKDGEFVDEALTNGVNVPTLPDEKVVATHVNVRHMDGGASGDFWQLYLFDSAGSLVSSSPLTAWGAGAFVTTCFMWDVPHTFTLCDTWFITGLSAFGLATEAIMRVTLEFVALRGGS